MWRSAMALARSSLAASIGLPFIASLKPRLKPSRMLSVMIPIICSYCFSAPDTVSSSRTSAAFWAGAADAKTSRARATAAFFMGLTSGVSDAPARVFLVDLVVGEGGLVRRRHRAAVDLGIDLRILVDLAVGHFYLQGQGFFVVTDRAQLGRIDALAFHLAGRRAAPGGFMAAALHRALHRAALHRAGEVVHMSAERELEAEDLAAQLGFLEQHVAPAHPRRAR